MRTTTLGEITRGRRLVTVSPDQTVQQAAEQMAKAYKGSVLVVGDGLQGIFTERDLLIRVAASGRDPSSTRIMDVMSTHLVVGHPEESYVSAIAKMDHANCRHLPVVDDSGALVGIVSKRELMALDICEFEREQDEKEPAAAFI